MSFFLTGNPLLGGSICHKDCLIGERIFKNRDSQTPVWKLTYFFTALQLKCDYIVP